MNKKLIFFVLGLIAVLVLANFYFINRDVETGTLTPQAASTDQPSAAGQPEITPPRQQPAATGSNMVHGATAGITADKATKRDHMHDTSWQKPDYQPTEEEQAREAILASLTPQERQEAQADLFKMSMFFRNVKEVDKAIAKARQDGNTEALEKLERFRMLAYPND